MFQDVVVCSPHQSPRCGVLRVEKVWMFWLPTMSSGNPAAKRQLPFGSVFQGSYQRRLRTIFSGVYGLSPAAFFDYS